MLRVPRAWSEVTPSWMTAALAPRCPGAVVSSVTLGPVDAGTNARARIGLTYAAGTGPASVFVKRPGRVLNRLALAALGAGGVEARLAMSGVALPLERPVLYAGGVDPRRLAAVVVAEDVISNGARPHDAVSPLGFDAAASGLAGLARLHAAFWERPLPPSLAFLRPWRLGPVWAAVSVASLARGFRRLTVIGAGSPVGAVGAAGLGRQFARSAAMAATGPQTVLHGDPHPGNTYGRPDGTTGFYDWQLARTGHWAHDVGYFLVASVSVEDRRAHQHDLLTGYLDALADAGAPAPGWDAAWERYRATPAFGLATWVHTLAIGTFQPPGVCLVTIDRFAAAYRDLDTATSLVS